MLICPSCQSPVDDSSGCRGCFFFKNCGLIRCSACGTEFVGGSHAASFLEKIRASFRKKKNAALRAKEGILLLSGVKERGGYRIVSMTLKNQATLARLTSYGLARGSLVDLRACSPSYLLRVGETDLALEPRVAEGIFVERV